MAENTSGQSDLIFKLPSQIFKFCQGANFSEMLYGANISRRNSSIVSP